MGLRLRLGFLEKEGSSQADRVQSGEGLRGRRNRAFNAGVASIFD